MQLFITILVTFIAGMGAGLGTGLAGMSAAAVIAPMLIVFLKIDRRYSACVGRFGERGVCRYLCEK